MMQQQAWAGSCPSHSRWRAHYLSRNVVEVRPSSKRSWGVAAMVASNSISQRDGAPTGSVRGASPKTAYFVGRGNGPYCVPVVADVGGGQSPFGSRVSLFPIW